MNKVLKQIFESNVVTSEDGTEYKLHSHLPEIECNILTGWMDEFKPDAILEIGLAYGVSAMTICDAIQDWSGVSYDIIDCFQNREWRSIGLFNMQKSGYINEISFHEERSEIQLPQFLKEKRKFDLVFVDGCHRFDHVFIDFFYVNKMLNTGGVVVFDDVHLKSIQKVLSFIDCYGGYEKIDVPEIDQKTQLKLRKMMGVPESRIIGYKKVKTVQQNWDWFDDF